MTTKTSDTTRRKDPKPIAEEKKEEDMHYTTLITTEKQRNETKTKNLSHSSSPAMEESSFKNPPRPNILIRLLLFLIHVALLALFIAYLAAVCLHEITDDYLYPQLKLMRWRSDGRDFDELTYYHRRCTVEDISANSIQDLLIAPNMTTEETTQHMMTHGASMYPNLLSAETAAVLREFIDKENRRQKGWFVIENENRYSWGIDMNMHPAFQTYWKELASNRQLVQALESIVGPDPAIIEFTAITSSYGAVDQHDHQDVVPPGSGAKFARSFIPSYSLFIPLQDTTYDMGATHVCPGTHLCSEGCEENCPVKNLPMSGRHGVWKTGWGALVNQQTTHKGMGHFCEGCLDRIVLIATFAPRPQTTRKLETRMIGQGGSYSLKWNHWGHTFSDFVNADTRMTEVQKYLRSMGLIKGNGWTFVAQASMRISNFEYGYNDPEDFLEDGGFSFLPKSWQALDEKQENSEENLWYTFMYKTLQIVEDKLEDLNKYAVGGFLALSLALDVLTRNSGQQKSVLVGSLKSLILSHGMTCLAFWLAMEAVNDSNWAKDIDSGKAYRLSSPIEDNYINPMTIPTRDDILITKHYTTDVLARYSDVLEYAHPGNRIWKNLVQEMSPGYTNLSKSLQKNLCQSMVRWMQTNRRFLMTNLYWQWERIVEEADLVGICHRQLISEAEKLTGVMLRQIDILNDDAENGRFRDTLIHEKFMPEYLDIWEEKFLPEFIDKKTARKSIGALFQPSKRKFLQSPITVERSNRTRTALPPLEEPREPYNGAWLEVGEHVEAKYRCKGDDWYHGTIVDALSNDGTYSVHYADGDIDEGRIDSSCIRRPAPFMTGEEVGFRTSIEGSWYLGNIIEILDAGSVSVKESSSGVVYDNISPALISRGTTPNKLLQNLKGRRVAVRWNGDEYYPGVIDEENEDGTYNIQYDDGDYQEKVRKEDIAFQ